ncbi:MAG: tetratricopeptide repeat protein [Candidatus Aminicenantes bacterium]|nr:tetratricopeptide repeat protein [Candidatus Aminicenantes bacterium]
MSKKSLLLLTALLFLGSISRAAVNPWSNLKKIVFYDSSGDMAAVKENLEQLDAQGLVPAEKLELQQKLNELGDRYFQKKNFPLAQAFYQKILQISPQNAWPLFNKLEKISRLQGNWLWNFKNVWRQFWLVGKDFSGAFLLLNTLFNVLFFSSLMLFYITTVAMFFKYFKLVTHDFLLSADNRIQFGKLALLLALLLWPLGLLGGWGYYPFLFCGFMWPYFKHEDRVNTKRIVGILLAMTLLNGFNHYLEQSLQSSGFQTVQSVYSGQLFPESRYNRFDNEMKVMQAYAYYNQHKADTAQDILQATGSGYLSTMKLNLLGNIYFDKGNMAQSIQFYRQSLSIDNRNRVTLKNFALALLKNNDPDLFSFYLKNYPEIQEYKSKPAIPQTADLPNAILWKRLLNFSWQEFHIWNFVSNLVIEFFKFPILLACLLMLVYTTLLKKLAPHLGQSTFCNKCAKIIKKKSIEQAHPLCEDCYQLFLIKDPIFLEAKIIKEKEISRRIHFQYALHLVASLFIPGYCLNFKDRSKAFTFACLAFVNVFGLYVFNALTFKSFFGTVPMFIDFIGMLAIVLYLSINAFSLRGIDHGF